MKKLLTLVLAGVAIKYFLDSDSGRELKTRLQTWWDDAQSSMKDMGGKGSSAANSAAGDNAAAS
jgi:hypothetical protein